MKRRLQRVLFGLALLTFFSMSVFANVSIKNGNFFIGYTDIFYPGGFDPKIERIYNSKTAFRGMFGWGWGTEYEVYLKVASDGSVVVHEYGGGAENRFSPVKFRRKDLKVAINRLIGAARKTGAVSTKKAIRKYRKKLRNDATFRNDEWDKFVRSGILKPRRLKAGTKLVSNRFSYQFITKVAGGYVRKTDGGKKEFFNEKGRLKRITNIKGNWIAFSYNKRGLINRIEDDQNRKMYLGYNKRGLLTKISGQNKKIAKFKYNKYDELIYSRDVDGHIYKYKYSDPKKRRHNLVQISYQDGTSMKMAYYSKKLFENIKSVRERDGSLTTYRYKNHSRNHFKTSVAVKGNSGRVISKSSYEYYLKYKATGEEWTYRLVTVLDGSKTDTIYNECCGLPLIIKKDGRETTFAYDKKGRVRRKSTPTELTKIKYDRRCGKIVRVDKVPKEKGAKRTWSKFRYDKKCNLYFASNSDKQGVKIHYNRKGQIASMVDQSRRRLLFKYNEFSKPKEIKDPKLGALRLSYSKSGQLKDVKGPAERRIAMKVRSAFANLLSIIQPAGVSLSSGR